MLDADVEVDRRDFAVRVSLSVAPGERLVLFGPSGAGKTTVLEAIAGLVTPRQGRIVLRDRVLTSTAAPAAALPPWQRRVGLLRQDPGLFPHLSVRDNLGYARGAGGAGGARGARRAPGAGQDGAALAEIAGQLEIGGLLSAMPARLSGGQAHRVALGRLLLADCDALLLDEPYSGLDAALRRTLTDLVIRLAEERQVPTIMVAHELAEAQAFAHRLAVLDRGTILQTGTPHEVVLHPATRRVAELVGYLGFVPLPATPPPAAPDPAHTVTAAHPDRVITDADPAHAVTAAADPGHAVTTAHRDRAITDADPAHAVTAAADPGHAVTAAADPGHAVTAAQPDRMPTDPDSGHAVIGVHPDRVIMGADAGRGVVFAGTMIACPAGAGWEADLRIGEATVVARLPDRPVPTDGQLVLTALDPPRFTPDGTAVQPAGQPPAPAARHPR